MLPVPSKQQGILKMILHGKELLTQHLLIFFLVLCYPLALRTLFGTGYQWTNGVKDPGREKEAVKKLLKNYYVIRQLIL